MDKKMIKVQWSTDICPADENRLILLKGLGKSWFVKLNWFCQIIEIICHCLKETPILASNQMHLWQDDIIAFQIWICHLHV